MIAAATAAFAVQTITSGGFTAQWKRAEQATRVWPSVEFLRGARLRPSADGMWRVVERVRALAPAAGDTVLLFPNDPDVEARFERPRPPLSSSILFVDQYWDRYVDHDFAVLQAHPPRVVVVGPRNGWRPFQHGWQPDRGAERLGVLLTEKLLPSRYTNAGSVPVSLLKDDFMDIFVLNDHQVTGGKR